MRITRITQIATVVSALAGALHATSAAVADGELQILVNAGEIGDVKLRMVDVQSGKTEVFGEYAATPKWSPDGRRIAFCTSHPFRIWLMDETGGMRVAVPTPWPGHSPVWSPDGKKIVFSAELGDKNRELFLMDADGKNPVNLSDHPSFDGIPAFSPDGGRIVFTSHRTGRPRLYAMHVDGSGMSDLLKIDVFYDAHPSYSPDGRFIAFCGRSTTGSSPQLFIARSDGSRVYKIGSDAAAQGFPAWSPDGRYIAYNRFDKWTKERIAGELVLFDIVSETHTPILNGIPNGGHAAPTWRPIVKRSGRSKE